jgi:hypothetical protein
MSETNSKQITPIIKKYLENINDVNDGDLELEVRFGTKNVRPINKIDFDNVIQKLKASGFELEKDNNYLLRIKNQYLDKKTGKNKMSNVRVEISSLNNIKRYCQTNSINNLGETFMQKKPMIINDEYVKPIDVNDYNFRISLQREKYVGTYSSFSENIRSGWADSKKEFRYINRTSLIHKTIPIRVDLSIMKTSKKTGFRYIPEYTFQDANVLENPESYEIELEILNNKVGVGTKFNTPELLEKEIKKTIKYVLSGLQGTNYPVPYKEIDNVSRDYLKIIGKDVPDDKYAFLRTSNFIGPSSYTLQLKNIVPISEGDISPNIRNNYTVTEKADGMRKLMFINGNGKVYLIDTNMNIQFTGVQLKNADLRNTILDGEHILHNKKGEFINLYASFDVYFQNNKDVRSKSFIPNIDDKNYLPENYRLPLLVDIVNHIKEEMEMKDKKPSIRIEHKNFKAENESQSIFQCCNTILANEEQGLYEYEIDGLIFTPAELGVGSSVKNKSGPLRKVAWDYSFKWKPEKFNTIDFLVTTKKNDNGQDKISNIFDDGKNSQSYDQIKQYKTLVLRVGFDEKKHGYINPCADVYEDRLPKVEDNDNEDNYIPMPFYPSNPTDKEASICNIELIMDKNGNKKMFTEENEVFEDETIVEFKYDKTKDHKWRWVPLRVRYDKTAEYKRGGKQYGNGYNVANSNWYSIHYPITPDMIRSGENIPENLNDDDIYYNGNSSDSNTDALCDFHNKYVKNKLITSASKKGGKLIDFAVGKGGDFPKWIKAKLSFVFGIDVSKDNIENRMNGACARYLSNKKQHEIMPSALFVQGNSGLNIKNGEGLFTEKGKQIVKAVFGEGPKDKKLLGEGVYKNYGKGKDGFNVCSCQFALHYFFENKRTLNNFMVNISDATAVNGYFIGTCYNGNAMFKELNHLEKGESMSLFKNDRKIWQVTKKYSNDTFDDNDNCLGYGIDVYQETINKTFREYLVNFDYLIRIMEDYGFVMLSDEECKDIGLPRSIGSFQQLYNSMLSDIKKKNNSNSYGKAVKMSPQEKQISYYNNYFIFKKVRNVNTSEVFNSLVGSTVIQEQLKKIETEKSVKAAKETKTQKLIFKTPKKLKKKLILKN